MPRNTIQQPPLSPLLWKHFNWHLWVGLAIWSGVVLPFVFVQYLHKRGSNLNLSFYAQNPARMINGLNAEHVNLAFYLLLFGLIFATIGGLVRHPFLALLSRKADSCNELVRKSLLVFVISVALLAFIPWPVAYNQFSISMVGHQFLICFLFSLPWLIATGLASRRLAVALGLPDAIQ